MANTSFCQAVALQIAAQSHCTTTPRHSRVSALRPTRPSRLFLNSWRVKVALINNSPPKRTIKALMPLPRPHILARLANFRRFSNHIARFGRRAFATMSEKAKTVSDGRAKLHGRAFYESIGSPKYIVAPMVDQSEFVSRALIV